MFYDFELLGSTTDLKLSAYTDWRHQAIAEFKNSLKGGHQIKFAKGHPRMRYLKQCLQPQVAVCDCMG